MSCRISKTTWRSSRQRAFTLIEVVVALALIGLLSVSLFEGLRFGQRTYDKAIRNGGASWEIVASQRLIRGIVESAYPQESSVAGASSYGLEGQRDQVMVTAAAPLAAGGAGLYRYEIAMRRGLAGQNDVLIRWRPDYAAAAPAPNAEGVSEELLIDRVAALEWSFLETSDSDDGSAPVWRNDWQGRHSLPRLVRLRVTFPPGDSRRWPDLVIAPRITDDANCAFDVVAQRCRAPT